MSKTKNHAEALALAIKSKEAYRADARKKTWEEKVAAIERMRRASREAKAGRVKR